MSACTSDIVLDEPAIIKNPESAGSPEVKITIAGGEEIETATGFRS